MNLNISSDKLDNPFLIDLLQHLSTTFASIDNDFFVIGATARDIVLMVLANTKARRKTRDLDLAIAVTGWDRYDQISNALLSHGFKKSSRQIQRFYWHDYEVDIVPYGDIANNDDKIYWPPEETIAMSVKGFDEALRDSITVTIDNDFDIKIASLHGLFILKLNAWLDRNLLTNKDAEDMWHIIDSYYFANENRDIHPEVYDIPHFDITMAGAYWMAHDIADILDEEQLDFCSQTIGMELVRAENSRLVAQILETHRQVDFDTVVMALKTIIDVFTQRRSND